MTSATVASTLASPPKPQKISTAESFIAGGIAACTAVTVTNTFEVAKTRLQLDGELRPKGEPRLYKNVFDALGKTYATEGIRGIQRGLGAAYLYQIGLNGSRLGFYEPFRQTFNSLYGAAPEKQVFLLNLTAGASSGAVGAIIGNPLFLVKARMQAYTPSRPAAAQHYYRNIPSALSSIVRTEGPKGLFRGMDAAILRTCMGSAVQLPAYNYAKTTLKPYMRQDSIWTYLLASTFSGASVCLVMQPADTALTRMYNQSPEHGLKYKNPIHCLYLTWKIEGVRGWYKGSAAHLLRIAPHTVLTLVVNEEIVRRYTRWKFGKGTELA